MQKKTFVFVDIERSAKEKMAINALKNKLQTNNTVKNNHFSYFGLAIEFASSLTEYIKSLNNDTRSSPVIVNHLTRVATAFLKSTSCNALWFTIRIMPPISKQIDKTRWHADGLYYRINEFKTQNKYQVKLAATLFGDGTVFKVDNDAMRTTFRETLDASSDRETMTKNMMPYESINPGENQVAIFAVGNKMKSAIHSEPNNHEWRFFYSIVPGSVDDIEELALRFAEPFVK